MAGLNSRNLRVPKTIKLFIGGEFPRTESGRSLPVHSRKTKALYAHLCRGSRKDLRNAVTAARAAQGGWEKKSAYNRGQILYRMAEMIEGKRAEFTEILREVLAHPPKRADAAVDDALDAFIYYAGFCDKYAQLIGTVNPVSGPHHNFTTPEPVGVVGVVFDRGLELGALCAQLAAILCSGNALVALLPEDGAAILAPLAEAMATSDLPKGVVNLLSGSVEELWRHFGSHMEIQSLCYVGPEASAGAAASRHTGQAAKGGKILTELKTLACGNMKRLVQPAAGAETLALERLLSFVEYKTVWHPTGF